MAFGALAGALNTMYSSVAARVDRDRNACARSGSAAFPAFVGTLVESLLLAADRRRRRRRADLSDLRRLHRVDAGGKLHAGGVRFQAQSALVAQGVTLALAVGLVGGLFPAISAARMPIVAGLHGT